MFNILHVALQYYAKEGKWLFSNNILRNHHKALTGVAELVGCHPTKQGVAGWIPGQGTCLGCGPGPQLGCVREATDQSFSHTLMFLSLSFPLSKK